MDRKAYADKTSEYLKTYIGEQGLMLLKTEFVSEDGNWYLRAYVDLTDEEREKRKEAGNHEENEEPGVGINDCAFVSRRLSKWLDKEDFIEETYTLEVCSRGYLDEGEEEIK